MIMMQIVAMLLFLTAGATLVGGFGLAIYLEKWGPFWYAILGCAGTGLLGQMMIEASERAMRLTTQMELARKQGALPLDPPATQTPDPGQDPPATD